MSRLLKPTHVAVTHIGTMVEITLGDQKVGMDYMTASILANWLKVHAATAKRNAGDNSHVFHAVGVLHNADDDIARFQEH